MSGYVDILGDNASTLFGDVFANFGFMCSCWDLSGILVSFVDEFIKATKDQYAMHGKYSLHAVYSY